MSLNNTDGPSTGQVWGYGFLFVTIINCGALLGVCVVPLMNKRMYKQVLMFLICLAVGTLSANAVLSLIPEAHGMVIDSEDNTYIWKNMTVIGGIYLFFLTERILKIITAHKKSKHKNSVPVQLNTVHTTALHDNSHHIHFEQQALTVTNVTPCNGCNDKYHAITANGEVEEMKENGKITHLQHGGGHCHDSDALDFSTGQRAIASVAYMIVFGDGLHNFIDGLAIGASFTHSIHSGISISIAVICEEFPHELGDFAILLKSGLTVKEALMANFASALTCYLGLVIGIILGEVTSAGQWIFALAGGMFLYISLVDMLPEINNGCDDDDPSLSPTSARVFLIQNAGLLMGFAIILLLTLYSSSFDISS